MVIVLSATLKINQKAAGPCPQLSRRTNLLSRIGIWDGGSVVITLNTHPNPMPVLPHQVGPRIHAYCSGIGKAILAFLDEQTLNAYLARTPLNAFTPSTITSRQALIEDLKAARAKGYSVDREEAVQGLGCIGAPIFDRRGAVAGALSLSGPVNQVLGERAEDLAAEVLATAAEISRFFGYFPGILDAGPSLSETGTLD